MRHFIRDMNNNSIGTPNDLASVTMQSFICRPIREQPAHNLIPVDEVDHVCNIPLVHPLAVYEYRNSRGPYKPVGVCHCWRRGRDGTEVIFKYVAGVAGKISGRLEAEPESRPPKGARHFLENGNLLMTESNRQGFDTVQHESRPRARRARRRARPP